jgi:aminobenzoyl-glutamate utilization protein B
MARFRPQMRRYYYDPSTYRTYLEHLGVTWPLNPPPTAVARVERRCNLT